MKKTIKFLSHFILICLGLILRLWTVYEFGPMIHEFDPQFNYRMAEIINKRSLDWLRNWNDELSWYPQGK
jgi:dolichyl-diphosphooligosaccharide--protein glycosyltransferase